MKTRHLIFPILLLSFASLPAAEPVPAAPMETPVIDLGFKFTAAQLDQLLGPIALYPDALIALILPAATAPSDIVLAARYLKAGGDPTQIEAQSWDDSVEALAHYPEIVAWMDENLAWTKQLGEAFAAQPADVMKAIQHLRAQARAAGRLVDTPQQQIVMEGDDISIVPAQPDVIYVPRYDTEVIYDPDQGGYATGPALNFGVGYPVGLWLLYDIDWRSHRIWAGSRTRDGHDHRDWRHPAFPGQPGYTGDPNRQPWQPRPYPAPRPRLPGSSLPTPVVVRPPPLPGAPPRPPGWHHDNAEPRNPPRSTTPASPPERPRGPERGNDDRRPPDRTGRDAPGAAFSPRPAPAPTQTTTRGNQSPANMPTYSRPAPAAPPPATVFSAPAPASPPPPAPAPSFPPPPPPSSQSSSDNNPRDGKGHGVEQPP